MLGRPSRALVIHPRWSRYRRSFVADNMFDAIRSTDQLRACWPVSPGLLMSRDLQAQRLGFHATSPQRAPQLQAGSQGPWKQPTVRTKCGPGLAGFAGGTIDASANHGVGWNARERRIS